MIKSFARQTLEMDFSTIETEFGRCSDIDMNYRGRNFTIIGEIKHESGTFTDGQRKLYENYAKDMIYRNVFIIYITHNARVEDGYNKVYVADCYVSEYYFKPAWNSKVDFAKYQKWETPELPITVNDFFARVIKKYDGVDLQKLKKSEGE